MAKAKGGLGKGLSALLPEPIQMDKSENTPYQLLNCDAIQVNPNQPRRIFDEDDLHELAQSIKKNGVLSPLMVAPKGEGYLLVSGERRLRAAKRAGLVQVPVLIRNLTDEEIAEIAIIENVQRANLSVMEEAESYHHLINQFGHSQQTVAQAVGKSRPYITNMLRLLQLSDELKTLLQDGQLSTGHARALLGLNDETQRLEIAQMVIEGGLTVRALEQLIKDINAPLFEEESPSIKKISSPKKENLVYLTVCDRLKEQLQTNVRIKNNGRIGKVEIEFYGDGDLTRILDALHVSLD